MKSNQLFRNQKAKILSQMFTGKTTLLEQLKPLHEMNRTREKPDFSHLSDEELEQLVYGKDDGPLGHLTDDQLEQIIAGKTVYAMDSQGIMQKYMCG